MILAKDKQMLTIGRALMGRSWLLLCDEPSLGPAPLVTQEISAGTSWRRVSSRWRGPRRRCSRTPS